jgi:pilus assembly protein CpaB
MRRAFGIIGAVVIALVGTMLLVGYVRSAEDRALEGEELVEVLVINEIVPRGTPAMELVEGADIIAEMVPTKVRAEGAVTDLATLGDLVTSTDLVPGEQLVAARFVAAETISANTRIEAPTDTLEVTISLTPERALGGGLLPGEYVAVVASFDPFDLNTIEPTELDVGEIVDPSEIFVGSSGAEEGGLSLKTPESTHLILHKILVTNVQFEQLPRAAAEDAPENSPPLGPTGNLLVTLAAPPEAVERIVFTAEHGFLWLAAEGEDAAEPVTPVQTRATVYR